MTREEFESQSATLACRLCAHVGLVRVENANNGGIRPGCPACGSANPIAGVQWLKQNRADSRRVKRPSGDPTPEEVWSANGNTCAYCGKTREECERYGSGITAQHVKPFSQEGAESPLVPFCSRCQQGSVAALAETTRIRRAFESVQEQLARLQEKQRELDTRRGA